MDQITQNWLFTLCRLVQGVNRAVVFSHAQEKDSFTPTVFWPDNLTDYEDLVEPAKIALKKGQCISLQEQNPETSTGEPVDTVACPLLFDQKIHGIIVVQMSSRIAANQLVAIKQIEAATVWLELMLKQHSSTKKSQLVTIVELVASCLEHEQFQAAATEVVTDLTTRLSCDRVSIGFLQGQVARVEAVSHTAQFDSKSSLIRDIGEAMYEAIEQSSTLVYPEPKDGVLLTRCHRVLAEEHKLGTILTVPLMVGDKVAGAILAERPSDRPFDLAFIEHFQHIVSMIGPVLEVRYREEQWLGQKIVHSLKTSLRKVIGPSYMGAKLGIAAVLLLVTLLSLISGQYRVTSDAKLEARTQRVMVAPLDGYIAESNVRPGDIIHSGDILGELDDKDLKLEQRKWASQLEQLQREYRDALAKHERSKVTIIDARILQAKAQLNLVEEQLDRIRFTAPFDGVIVSGDLSQALGSPVERGQVLFTVAPLVSYRVILQVDERDIGYVKEGQEGRLVLSGMPAKPLLFSVEKITPVSRAAEGRNSFQVEAKMKKSSDLLRPGMEGVAKIDIEQRKLLWIWSHRLVDWLRLTLWSLGA